MRSSCISVMLCLSLFASTAHAGTEPDERAKQLFFEGNRRARAGDYAGAVVKYRAAYAAISNPKILHNLAVTLARLGRNAEAAETYAAYLRDPARNPHRVAEVALRLRELDAKVARITIEVSVADATIYLDGELLALSSAGRSRRVEPGRHIVAANSKGFRTSRTSVTVTAGETRVVKLELVRVKAALDVPDREAPRPASERSQTSPSAKLSISAHPSRLGGYVRTDIDGNSLGRGAVVIAALSYQFTDRLQLAAGALLGTSPGIYAGAMVTVGAGRIRPTLLAGVPIQLADTTMVGLHAAAGVHLSFARQLGLLVSVGVEHFVAVPTDFQPTVFVPSIGLTWRR